MNVQNFFAEAAALQETWCYTQDSELCLCLPASPQIAILKAFLVTKPAPSGQTQHLISSINQSWCRLAVGVKPCQVQGGSGEPCTDTS